MHNYTSLFNSLVLFILVQKEAKFPEHIYTVSFKQSFMTFCSTVKTGLADRWTRGSKLCERTQPATGYMWSINSFNLYIQKQEMSERISNQNL